MNIKIKGMSSKNNILDQKLLISEHPGTTVKGISVRHLFCTQIFHLRGWFGFRRYKNFFQQCLLRIRLRISISVLRVPSGNSSIVSVSIDGMSSTWSLNSLLFHKYVGRFVEENTLPLQILLTFHDTCKSVAKCSRSVSRFRTCGFHLSLLKGSKSGVG